MKKVLLYGLSIMLIIFSQGCSLNEVNNNELSNAAKTSLLNDFYGIQWGDSLNDVCAVLDDNIEYEIIQPGENEIFTSIYLVDDNDFNGLNVEKILHFRTIDEDNTILVDISYAFESFDDVYSLLKQELGEPDNIDNINANRVSWTVLKVSDVFSQNEIEGVYKLLDFDTAEALSNEIAESYTLHNVNGQGYLVDDGSVIASINTHLY